MPLDPTNPAVPADTSLETWRLKDVAAKERTAAAAELLVQTSSGDPATEGGIYLRILCSVLMGKLAGSSGDAQIWAADLTRDYLLKYNLDGTPKG